MLTVKLRLRGAVVLEQCDRAVVLDERSVSWEETVAEAEHHGKWSEDFDPTWIVVCTKANTVTVLPMAGHDDCYIMTADGKTIQSVKAGVQVMREESQG